MKKFPDLTAAFDESAGLNEHEKIIEARYKRQMAEHAKERLAACPDYQAAKDACMPGANMLDLSNLSKETISLMRVAEAAEVDAQAMAVQIYGETSRADLRDALRPMVDKALRDYLPSDDSGDEMGFAHELLYLSSYGGAMKPPNTVGGGIMYEFNTPLRTESVDFDLIEFLHGQQLLKTLDTNTENNLTARGRAFLRRMDEIRGPSEAQRAIESAMQKHGPIKAPPATPNISN